MSYVIIQCLIIFAVVCVIFKHSGFPKIFPLLYIGLCLMTASNIMYMMNMSNLRQEWLVNTFRDLRYLLHTYKISMHTLKNISVIGEVMMLSFFVLFASTLDKNNRFKYCLAFIPVAAYFYLNLPDTLYAIYLHVNTAGQKVISFNALLYIKQSIVLICFMCPYIAIYAYYRRTILLIVKRNLILCALITAFTQIAIAALSYFGVTDNIFNLTLEILFIKNVPENFILSGVLIFAVLFTVALSVYMIFRSKVFTSQIRLSKISIYKKSAGLDKNLRMILHTYKNMFFSFKQLSALALADGVKPGSHAEECLDEMSQIANSALYMLTSQLEMLRKIDLSVKPVNISEAINLAIEKMHCDGKIRITVSINTSETYITADSFYLTELFYTLLTNSAEALNNVRNPQISVTVYSEGSWFLFEVYDNGAGIDKKIQRRIFKPLVSGKSGSKNWGIGLYYVSKIVSAHKGYIFLESKPGQYTQFQIYLPKLLNKGEKRNENQNTAL